jgi:hypothetical protein
MSTLMGIDAGKRRDVKAKELAIRFGFGAAVSVLAGVVSLAFGPKAGGLFLAFPAILPASATLVEKKEGRRAAAEDLSGAATAWFLFDRTRPVIVLVVALTTWLAFAVGLYLVVASVGQRRQTHTSPIDGSSRTRGPTHDPHLAR